MQIHKKSLPNSIHFSLKVITDGIYAVLSSDGGGAIGNAGIIDLGDRTVVFDTFETPIAAEDLRVASEILTGRQATWVVNSHAHPDHWFGNQVFNQNTFILASQKTREHMAEFIEEVEQDKSDPSELEEYLESQKKQLLLESAQRKRRSLKSSIARWQFYLESLPNLHLRLPNQSFVGKIELHGSQRSVELIDAGAAHTPGDSYLTIPSEKIAFIGDLGFFNQLPYMADCDPNGWKSMLKELNNSAFETFIPGHGPPGVRKDLVLIEDYIVMLEKYASRAVTRGGTVDDVINQQLPEPYTTWSIDSPRKEVNSQFMFEYFANSGRI